MVASSRRDVFELDKCMQVEARAHSSCLCHVTKCLPTVTQNSKPWTAKHTRGDQARLHKQAES